MASEHSDEEEIETVEWLSARSALVLVAASLGDDDKAKAAIFRRVCRGLIRTKAAIFAGFIEPGPQRLQRVAGHDAEIPAGFWGPDWDFSAFDWITGDFLSDGPPVLGVQFAKTDIMQIVPNMAEQSSNRSGGKSSAGGRPPANWWPYFAEELAVYIHEKGAPIGIGNEGQSLMIDQIFDALAKREIGQPGRATVQPVISAVLRRIRST